MESGRYIDAAEAFEWLRLAHPEEVTFHQMAANAWKLAGDTVKERASWLGAFALRQNLDTPTLYAIGGGLLQAGAPFEAVACLEIVGKARPKDGSALGALAGALRASGELDRAWSLISRALSLSPRSATLCLTAAQIRHSQGDLVEAHRWLDKADRIRPNHGPTQLQRGMTWLLGGPCAAGWAGFEERGLPTCPTSARSWYGEPLTGQSILVLAEQGAGDLFHFLRFVPLLALRGAGRVVVEAPESFRRLLEQNGFEVAAPDRLPATDWYVPVLSLPHRLETDRSYGNERMPYLITGANREPSGLNRTRRRRYGVAWRGNPAFLATALRDLDPGLLPRFPHAVQADWISLQVDLPPPDGFVRPVADPRDWLDTARLLETLDAVISVDTAIAHLAGALGLPTLVLLPFSPDWRWGLREGSTRWYPSATLVRQSRPRDWQPVLDQVVSILQRPQYPCRPSFIAPTATCTQLRIPCLSSSLISRSHCIGEPCH
jgi:tetratricopeptide (TPR) repeat protein